MKFADSDAPNITLVLQALGDPMRLEIVKQLSSAGELQCNRISLPVSKSTMSHHFQVLYDAGITHEREDGVRKFLSLRTDDLEVAYPGLLQSVMAAS